MTLNDYNDGDSSMVEYRFRFIGKQECAYERKNAYESEDLYFVPVELFNPVTKQVETRTITKWYSPVTHADVVQYINNIIEIKKRADMYERNEKRKKILLEEYKNNRNYMTVNELYELIDLLQDRTL